MKRHASQGPLFAAVVAVALSAAADADEARVATLVERGPAVADMACPANGQAVYCLDADSGGITAIDPFEPAKRRAVVGPAEADGPQPVAIGCIETNTLAAICRSDAAWSLRTWRLRPDAAVAFAEPLQEVALGAAAASAARVHLLVGQTREWLAAAGLPEPLQPVVRGPIARANVGRMSARGCPVPPPAAAVLAVAAAPFDELVLFTARPPGTATVSYHGRAGRTLLELECDLPLIRDAACCHGDGMLWAAGGDRRVADRPEGLWRIDAAYADGRQVARPACVARLAAARAVACVADTAVVVAHGDAGRTLVRYDLSPRAVATDEERGP